MIVVKLIDIALSFVKPRYTINQRPIVRKGDKVEKGEAIADGPSTDLEKLHGKTYW